MLNKLCQISPLTSRTIKLSFSSLIYEIVLSIANKIVSGIIIYEIVLSIANKIVSGIINLDLLVFNIVYRFFGKKSKYYFFYFFSRKF